MSDSSSRVEAVDVLRGLVMVIMALDHVREYFSVARGLEPSQVSLVLFFTRWVTHFCAPTFVFLAGTSAYLSLGQRRTPAQLSRFLVTRALWLLFAELTFVNFGWFMNTTFPFNRWILLQVIWAIGVSMIVLAGLVRLPLRVSGIVGVALIGGHNLFDGVQPADLGLWANAWRLLHVQEPFALGPITVFSGYPVLPWIGVMAAGYAFGAMVRREQGRGAEGSFALIALGGALTLAFIVLRALDVYGEPSHWAAGETIARTLMSFLNTTKYPPSLLFLLMTLGPSIALLGVWLQRTGPVTRALAVYGRVPFFYYIIHAYLIHLLAILAGSLQGFPSSAMRDFAFFLPKAYGFSLPVVYAIWIAIVVALYPLCVWFAGVKARHRDRAWLSYL